MSDQTLAAPLEHDSIHLDWLTVTHRDVEQLRQLTRGALRPSRHVWPYKWAEEDEDGVRIMGGGPLPRPYLLEIRGEAFRNRRAAGKDDIGTVAMAAFNGAHCTRLDLARDVTNDLTPAWLRAAWDEGRCVSLWRRRKWTDEGSTGHMLRLGGSESLLALRVYDKRAEMLQRGEGCSFARLTRWELVLRGERAQVGLDQLSRLIVGTHPETGEDLWPVHPLWCSWLSHNLTVAATPVDRTNKHQTRAVADSKWGLFVSARNGATLAPDARETNTSEHAAKFAKWFLATCAPSVHVMAKLVGWKAIYRLARASAPRVGPKQRRLLNEIDAAKRSAQAEVREVIGPRPKSAHKRTDPELLKPSGALAYLSLQKGYGPPARERRAKPPLRKAE